MLHGIYTMVWASTYNSRLSKLITLQKRALRVIAKAPHHRLHKLYSKDLFTELNLLNLHQIKTQQIAAFMFGFTHNLLPSDFNDYFQRGSDIHTHYTRSSSNYRPALALSNSRKFSAKHIGPSVWNKIPTEICQATNLYMFKKMLRTHLISNQTDLI